MTYSIGEFSSLTNLSIYTLRYYEKEKLIIPIRSINGRRCYSDNDVTWINFIKRLKDTGMPIKEISRYAILRSEGDATMSERMELLIKHREVLHVELLNLQENINKLDDKILYYKTEIETSSFSFNG